MYHYGVELFLPCPQAAAVVAQTAETNPALVLWAQQAVAFHECLRNNTHSFYSFIKM